MLGPHKCLSTFQSFGVLAGGPPGPQQVPSTTVKILNLVRTPAASAPTGGHTLPPPVGAPAIAPPCPDYPWPALLVAR
jgi:hypothetical protein